MTNEERRIVLDATKGIALLIPSDVQTYNESLAFCAFGMIGDHEGCNASGEQGRFIHHPLDEDSTGTTTGDWNLTCNACGTKATFPGSITNYRMLARWFE